MCLAVLAAASLFGLWHRRRNGRMRVRKRDDEARLDANFARVLAAYPCSERTEAARAEWQNIAPPPATVEHMLRAIEAQKDSDRWRTRPSSIPYLARWLREERWQDTPAADASPEAIQPGAPRRPVEETTNAN